MNANCIFLLFIAGFSYPGLATRSIETNPAIEFDDPESSEGWLPAWMSWTPTSQQKVREAERNLMEYVETESTGFFVNIGMVNGEKCRVWTRKFGTEGSEIPLVMVHGMGAGLAMFALNFDSLASNRLLYAIDLPGFGRSSRINFSSNSTEIENEYTIIIEQWRKILGLNKMNLLGHSFGGYLTGLYALQYPQNIHLLVLADPWGMTEKPEDWKPRRKIPGWAKALGSVLINFNPLWGLRASGPAGPWLVSKMRPDLMRKYEDLLGVGNTTLISEYLFHCNAQDPTGEAAFHSLMTGFGWPSNPLLPRLSGLDRNVHMKVFYGSNSWMTHLEEEDFVEAGVEAAVNVEYIEDSGHHVYADQYKDFNEALNSSLMKHDMDATII